MFNKNCHKLDKKIKNIALKNFYKALDFFEKVGYASVKSNKKLSAILTLA
ncbi:hypothetical protein MICAE_500001 [Microcystis aeruginosa PCC 9806]|uniref:Uncharacterized protein n=1 Tax=Microcystis aeruginosa PCC 9806 TaxID=1160282 RepID=I4GZD9_MICAE|nr:hypothetical protein [Microcystis aeruginosa]CCI15163.1 hypothetical protein MICAE_500001 [Microcystis aeruginosa PCC 9806]